MFCRMAEVYAGFSEYTDAQVGRIVDYLEESGQLENTLIFYCADNGASGEGSPDGSVNEGKIFGGYPDDLEQNLHHGRPARARRTPTTTTRPAGRWRSRRRTGCSSATPTRAASATRWSSTGPRASHARGEVRQQYHHCTDIVPRSTRPAASSSPTSSTGYEQTPLSGVSMVYSFDDADAPTAKQTQYYEMLGSRGIWHQGWKAVTEHGPMAGIEQLRRRQVAAVPHRRGPLRGTRRLRRPPGEGQGARRPVDVEEAKANNVLPLNDLQIIGNPKDFETFIAMEFKVPVPPSGQYTYYPGTTRDPRTVGGQRAQRVLQGARRRRADRRLAGRDLRPRVEVRRPLAVREGRQGHLRLQLPGDPARGPHLRARCRRTGRHIIGVEFVKERMGEHREGIGPLQAVRRRRAGRRAGDQDRDGPLLAVR